MIKKDNKKGLSQVVSTAVLIAITVGLIAGIWAVIDAFVNERLDTASACQGVIEKITFNNDYTCYNQSGGYVQISIERGEIDPESILIAVGYNDSSETYLITETPTTLQNFRNYDGATSVSMPNREGRRTYIAIVTEKPKKLQIAPTMGRTSCDITDSMDEIPTCL